MNKDELRGVSLSRKDDNGNILVTGIKKSLLKKRKAEHTKARASYMSIEKKVAKADKSGFSIEKLKGLRDELDKKKAAYTEKTDQYNTLMEVAGNVKLQEMKEKYTDMKSKLYIDEVEGRLKLLHSLDYIDASKRLFEK